MKTCYFQQHLWHWSKLAKKVTCRVGWIQDWCQTPKLIPGHDLALTYFLLKVRPKLCILNYVFKSTRFKLAQICIIYLIDKVVYKVEPVM